MKYWTMLLEVTLAVAAVLVIVNLLAGNFDKKEPENFDSMLCQVHTPMGSLLINDELITCTNGKKYRVAK
jgi:hypothetical protein